MRETMTPDTLRKKQIEFIAIGVVGIIAVGIFAALDAGNDLGEVLVGLVQFLFIVGIGVSAYFHRHRLMQLIQPKVAPPVIPTQEEYVPLNSVQESRMVQVAPGKHQLLTFEETANELSSAVHKLHLAQSLQSQHEKVVGELNEARAQLRAHHQAAQKAINGAVGAATTKWEQERAAMEERHASALQRLQQERDEALTGTSSRAGLPELLQVITAAKEGRLTRDLTKKVASLSNADYGPFAQSVRRLFESPSPIVTPLVMPQGITGETAPSSGDTVGEGIPFNGRTEVEASDGPADQPSDGVAGYAIVVYDPVFARIAA